MYGIPVGMYSVKTDLRSGLQGHSYHMWWWVITSMAFGFGADVAPTPVL